MTNLIIKPLLFDQEAIKALYIDNKWYAYTNDLDSLYRGIQQSTESFGAYIDDLLVGLIRVISDKETICYIQDILILESHQRQGIGTKLINTITTKYSNCRQILLMTDNTDKQKQFYQSCGFQSYQEVDAIGYKYIQNK